MNTFICHCLSTRFADDHYSFSIDDTRSFDEYQSGGVVTLVKQSQTVNFVSHLIVFVFISTMSTV